jgi:hypothetical protein
MFTTTRTCDNTPYHSDEDEQKYDEEQDEKVTYHTNPESIRQLNPNSQAEQAYLFCNACNQWKKLSSNNIKTIDYRFFSYHKQYYSSGSCLTDECYDEIERKIKTEQRIEEQQKKDKERELERENEIMYHMDPAGVIKKHPELEGQVQQAFIFCITCEQWKNLSYDNSKTLPQNNNFRYQKQMYRGGHCLTDECKQLQQERAIQKRKDERFWNQVDIMEKRCDESQKRSDAIWKKGFNEQNENKK